MAREAYARTRYRSGTRTAGHVEIRFVQESRRPEREIGATPREVTLGQPVQFVVQRSEQILGGCRVAALGVGEEFGYCGRHQHHGAEEGARNDGSDPSGAEIIARRQRSEQGVGR
jgi:hypothetical protein